MECVAYLRVSTEKQAEEGHGLESQKRDIESYCRKNELIIVDWYVDDGYTGSNMDRPEFQRLISDCYAKRVKCVVAYKLDRISRTMLDSIYVIERIFQPNNVRLECVHDAVNYNDPMQQAYTQMMAVFAQLDKNTMMLRMRGGILERVKKGYWPGGGIKPYCYRYDKEIGILIPIPERAERARQALDLFIQGYSDEKIMRMLGFRTEGVVRNILTGVVNIGKIKYKGNVYQGRHEPIFDVEKFNLGLEIRKTRSKARAYCRTEPNLLTGLCYCGVCGCKMRYQKWGSDRRKMYCCSRNRYLDYLPNYNHDCDNSVEWADKIEEQVESEILKISLNLSSYKPKEKATKLEIMQSQLDKSKTKLRRLYELYADGNDMVLDMISNLENEIEISKERIKEESKNIQKENKKEYVYENIKNLADVWDTIDKTKKNTILKSIISKVVVVNGNVDIQLKSF